MGEKTGIAWTDSTFNPWVGCQRVSPGCENCYAEALDKRVGGAVIRETSAGVTHTYKALRWGPLAPRVRTTPPLWRNPIKWNRRALAAGKRHRVFCSSMADVFEDRPELVSWRADLFELILQTPALDWQLLTKRPQNIARLWPRNLNGPGPLFWPNVWLGCTVEDQQRADERVPHLLKVPAAVRFLSCEPLLEKVSLTYGRYNRPGLGWKVCPTCEGSMSVPIDGGGKACPTCYPAGPGIGTQGLVNAGIDWVICGGESGGRARPFELAWARGLRDECRELGAAFFMKQLGNNPITEPGPLTWPSTSHHGADPAEWPEDLRRQAFPRAA